MAPIFDIILDPERGQLAEILEVIDAALAPLLAVVSWNEQARESADYWVGAGFVACQKYMGTVAAHLNVEKKVALDLGPIHRSGASVASILNAGANSWKHGDDWDESAIRAFRADEPEPKNPRRDIALSVLGKVLDDNSWEYHLCNTLYALCGKTEFAPVVPLLAQWTDEVRKVAPKR